MVNRSEGIKIWVGSTFCMNTLHRAILIQWMCQPGTTTVKDHDFWYVDFYHNVLHKTTAEHKTC